MRNTIIRLVLVAGLFGSAAFVSAQEVSSNAWLLRGKEAQNKGDYPDAFQCFKMAAQLGDVEAEYHLGYCYLTGQGTVHDDAMAVKWFKKSAFQGDSQSEYSLAYCYENGWGTNKDLDKAREEYQKAAQRGFAGAQAALNRMDATPTPSDKTVDAPVISAATSTYENVEPAIDSASNTSTAKAGGTPSPDRGASKAGQAEVTVPNVSVDNTAPALPDSGGVPDVGVPKAGGDGAPPLPGGDAAPALPGGDAAPPLPAGK